MLEMTPCISGMKKQNSRKVVCFYHDEKTFWSGQSKKILEFSQNPSDFGMKKQNSQKVSCFYHVERKILKRPVEIDF